MTHVVMIKCLMQLLLNNCSADAAKLLEQKFAQTIFFFSENVKVAHFKRTRFIDSVS